MKTLVFGKSGQVALALARIAPDAVFLGRDTCDLAHQGAAQQALDIHRPDAVINAAAYTAVDKAEEEEDLATRINGAAVGEIARWCAAADVPFVHISTDYVFDGTGDQPFAPDAPTAPLGAYGRSKLAGEKAIAQANGPAAILRTAGVFSADGHNFVKTMLRLGGERDQLDVVCDQITGPTPAADIAQACLTMVQHLQSDPQLRGIYHLNGQPWVSWADFARAIFEISGQRVDVTDIPASNWPTPAKRPSNSRLDCATLTQTFGINPPDWRAALPDIIAEIMA